MKSAYFAAACLAAAIPLSGQQEDSLARAVEPTPIELQRWATVDGNVVTATFRNLNKTWALDRTEFVGFTVATNGEPVEGFTPYREGCCVLEIPPGGEQTVVLRIPLKVLAGREIASVEFMPSRGVHWRKVTR